jgi:DNA-binding transcriptional regulator YhcF (GntR family)
MSRAQPGAVILDQLRDRIVTGLYFGNWQPGERLPSIRDIADAESVDRKTAAAAYHRLEEEGLVEVKPRSGVFLRDERGNGGGPGGGPLERLQKRWLKNTYEGARALGLETRTVLKLFQAVGAVETTAVPVLEEDEATARTVAEELRRSIGIDARPLMLHEVSTRLAQFSEAPFVVTTPYFAARVSALLPHSPLIVATLSLELLHDLIARAEGASILVAVPSEWIARRVESALRQRGAVREEMRVAVVGAASEARELRADATCVFVWPGCESVFSAFPGDECVMPVRLLSEATLDRVRTGVLEAALRYCANGAISMSSGGGTRAGTAVAAP